MPPDKLPSSFTLWLDEALTGWIAPVAALAVLAAGGGLYLLGVASEEATATLLVAVVAAAAALYLVRPALDARGDAVARALAAAAAVATLAAVALPALRTVHPGDPLFAGEVGSVDETVPVPEGASGAVRLLVSGKLPDRGEPSVAFTLAGTSPAVEGKLERTFGSVRVGRSGRARVAHDHTADYYPARLPAGVRAIRLDRLQGQLGSPLRIAVYREPIPFAGGPWLLGGLALLLGCLADARLGQKNVLGVAAGMAVAFGLLVTYNATPAAAVGQAVGGVVLGAITGSLAGWLLGLVVRRLVPPAPRRTSRARGAAAA